MIQLKTYTIFLLTWFIQAKLNILLNIRRNWIFYLLQKLLQARFDTLINKFGT